MEPQHGLLRRFWYRSHRYFAAYSETAAAYNLTTLWRCLLVFTALLLIYGPVIFLIYKTHILVSVYLVTAAADLLFFLFVLLYKRRRKPAVRVVRWACVLFMVMTLGFTAAINVFPFPESPSLFYPMVYMLVSVLFLLPVWQTVLTLSLTSGVYLLLAAFVETPAAFEQDLFAAITAWFLGIFLVLLVADLRISEGERRMELEYISTTDPLTGLPNRRWVEENLPLVYRRCQMKGLAVSVIMMDVDDFKIYNDAFGHQAGDACLAAVGRLLREFSAELSVYAARYGGEEFIFLLSGCCAEEAMDHAQTLLTRIRTINLPNTGGGTGFTASLGVASEDLPGEGDTYANLVRKADAALYHAKDRGKDRAFLHQPGSSEIRSADESSIS